MESWVEIFFFKKMVIYFINLETAKLHMSLDGLYFKKVGTMKNNEMDHKYTEGKLCMRTNLNCPVGATVASHLEKNPLQVSTKIP